MGYCPTPNNGTDPKYCYYRPGTQSDYCAGSPAISGNRDPEFGCGADTIGSQWISQACSNGCSGLNGAPATPSNSPTRSTYWSSMQGNWTATGS